MKIIEQSYEIINRSEDQMKLIERCGRICYKSEDKITDTSAEKFVGMLAARGHHSVLEHGTLAVGVNSTALKPMYELLRMFPTDAFKYVNITEHGAFVTEEGNHMHGSIISGNVRAWVEMIQTMANSPFNRPLIKKLYDILYACFPVICDKAGLTAMVESICGTDNYNNVRVYVLSTSDILDTKVTEQARKHIYATVHFITNRGVTHELVRHRPASFSQESTRYVKYGDDMEFILPVWFDPIWAGDWTDREQAFKERFGKEDSQQMLVPSRYLFAWEEAKDYYKFLIDQGERPEQAREVLPNALKTEIVVTANLAEWKHIFGLRCSSAAHPQIRELMLPIQEDFQMMYPEVFLV